MIDTDEYEGHTPAPWNADDDGGGKYLHIDAYGEEGDVCVARMVNGNWADTQLIADAPLLLAEVLRLREVLRDVKSDIDSYLNGGWNGVEGWEAISSIIGALGIQTDMDLMMEESE